MMPSAIIESYARQCEKRRNSPLPDFKIYIYDGTAYLLAISARANTCLIGCIDNYQHYKPVRLSAEQLNMLSDWVKDRRFTVEQESI